MTVKSHGKKNPLIVSKKVKKYYSRYTQNVRHKMFEQPLFLPLSLGCWSQLVFLGKNPGGRGGGGGIPYKNWQGCSSEILESTPKSYRNLD